MLIHSLDKLIKVAKSGGDTQPIIKEIINDVAVRQGRISKGYLAKLDKCQDKIQQLGGCGVY